MARLKGKVVVLTGATSGVGLATARLAARRGARLVLVARSADALERVAAELREGGAEVVVEAVDVADEAAAERIADRAEQAFGRIDVWVNNAAVGLVGRVLHIPLADERRLFEVNFWAAVYGCQAAVRRMAMRGGTVINVTTALAHRASAPHGTASAAAHALKAYTSALRLELEHDDVPVVVTLVKASRIASPLHDRARKYVRGEAPLPFFAYAPRLVARTILTCAVEPPRDVVVGGLGALPLRWVDKLAPRQADRISAANLRRLERAEPEGEDALYRPMSDEGRERGSGDLPVLRHSPYTAVALRPGLALLATAALGALLLVRR